MIGAEIATLEQNLNLNFIDKTLLQRAFIHRSYLNELSEPTDLADNERLEFLGDSVLNYVMGEYLYGLFPDYKEGPLTNLRAALVRRETLARLSTLLDLGKYLWLGYGEEESQGRTRAATLCAVFEALIGAIHQDRGLVAVRSFLLPLMAIELERVKKSALEKDPKTRLQEWVQSNKNLTPRHKTVETHGPDHAKTFVMQVTVGGQIIAVAQGRSKQDATQAAAAMALDRFGLPAPEYQPDPELEARYGLR